MESRTCFNCAKYCGSCTGKTTSSGLKTEECTCDNWVENGFFECLIDWFTEMLQGPMEPE